MSTVQTSTVLMSTVQTSTVLLSTSKHLSSNSEGTA